MSQGKLYTVKFEKGVKDVLEIKSTMRQIDPGPETLKEISAAFERFGMAAILGGVSCSKYARLAAQKDLSRAILRHKFGMSDDQLNSRLEEIKESNGWGEVSEKRLLDLISTGFSIGFEFAPNGRMVHPWMVQK